MRFDQAPAMKCMILIVMLFAPTLSPARAGILSRSHPAQPVQLICHRTANRDMPENTLESLALAARMGATGRIAVVGYGLGGRYAFLAVTRLGADAAAAFYGNDIGAHLNEASRVKKPSNF